MKPPSETATITAIATPQIVTPVRTGRRRRFFTASARYRRNTIWSSIISSLERDGRGHELEPAVIGRQPAFHPCPPPFPPRSGHGDIHQVHAQGLPAGMEGEKAAHGPALLAYRSRNRHRLAGEVARLLHQ